MIVRSRRERLRIRLLIDGSRSSIFAVTVDFTYVSGTRCGTTMISVSERYCLAIWRARKGDAESPRANGRTISQPRCARMRMISDGAKLLPGSTHHLRMAPRAASGPHEFPCVRD